MKKFIPLIICLAIPFLVTSVATLSTSAGDSYSSFNTPSFAPPSIVFPIVWTVLYLLMGISSYLIYSNNIATKEKKNKALTIYGIQLVLNAIWPFIFFNLQMFLFAYILILVMILLVIYMIYLFYDISKIAAYLQIPYLAWLGFASILNLAIFILN